MELITSFQLLQTASDNLKNIKFNRNEEENKMTMQSIEFSVPHSALYQNLANLFL